MQRFAKFCKKLQKKCASLHNFSPSAALLIDISPAETALFTYFLTMPILFLPVKNWEIN